MENWKDAERRGRLEVERMIRSLEYEIKRLTQENSRLKVENARLKGVGHGKKVDTGHE